MLPLEYLNMSIAEILSIASSLFGLIFSPLGAYLAWRSYKKAGQASERTDMLARRITGRSIDDQSLD
jgi:hypothetical protein